MAQLAAEAHGTVTLNLSTPAKEASTACAIVGIALYFLRRRFAAAEPA